MKLNQVLAIEKGVRERNYRGFTDLHKQAQKPEPYYGFSKKYEPKDEGGETFPPESKRVQLRADTALKSVKGFLTAIMNITATKDFANTSAKADVTVNGVVLLADAPVTYLLSLEKTLTDVKVFIEKMPTLDEAEDWQKEEASGLFKTAEIQKHRPAKVQEPIVLYPATPEHPAQTQLVTRDVIIGFWTETKSSGAITKAQQEKYVEKTEELLKAVKFARETANSVDAEDKDVGDAFFAHIFG